MTKYLTAFFSAAVSLALSWYDGRLTAAEISLVAAATGLAAIVVVNYYARLLRPRPKTAPSDPWVIPDDLFQPAVSPFIKFSFPNYRTTAKFVEPKAQESPDE